MPARRLDPSGPGTADLAGVRLTVSSLVRWSPLVLAAALLGWLLGSAIPSLGHHDRATATLALNSEVVWPYYDATITRQAALFDEAGVRAAAEAMVGATADDVDITVDETQTNAAFWLTVEAEDPDDAVALAAAMADGLVAANLAEQRDELQPWIDDLTGRLAERQQVLTDLQQQLDVQKFGNDTAGAALTEDQIAAASRTIADLTEELASAEADLAGTPPRVDVVAPAAPGDDRSDDVRAGLVTAAVLALAAIALAPTLDRRVARVRSVAQLRRIWPDIPVVAEGPGTDLLGDDLASMVELVAFGRERPTPDPAAVAEDERAERAERDERDDASPGVEDDEGDEDVEGDEGDEDDGADRDDEDDEDVGRAEDERAAPASDVDDAPDDRTTDLVVLTTDPRTAGRIPAGVDVVLLGSRGSASRLRAAGRVLVVVPRGRIALHRLDAVADELVVLEAPVRAVVLARR